MHANQRTRTWCAIFRYVTRKIVNVHKPVLCQHTRKVYGVVVTSRCLRQGQESGTKDGVEIVREGIVVRSGHEAAASRNGMCFFPMNEKAATEVPVAEKDALEDMSRSCA